MAFPSNVLPHPCVTVMGKSISPYTPFLIDPKYTGQDTVLHSYTVYPGFKPIL